jgi:hypothetical protein
MERNNHDEIEKGRQFSQKVNLIRADHRLNYSKKWHCLREKGAQSPSGDQR